MANSSDWLGRLAGADAPPPDWLALLGAAPEFREALPGINTPGQCPAPQAVAQPVSAPPADPAPDALAQAFAEGEAAGRAAALAEAEHHAARQRSLRLAFRTLDEAASAVLADDLAATVIALCEGVLGTHAADRPALLARCREAASRLGGAPATLRLHLHPDDIAHLGAQALEGWTVIADSALEPGGLLLEGADGAVRDGPSDWRRAIAAAVRG